MFTYNFVKTNINNNILVRNTKASINHKLLTQSNNNIYFLYCFMKFRILLHTKVFTFPNRKPRCAKLSDQRFLTIGLGLLFRTTSKRSVRPLTGEKRLKTRLYPSTYIQTRASTTTSLVP